MWDGGGYKWDFPSVNTNNSESYERALLQLNDLREGPYLDEFLRALFIDVNLFNPTTRLHTLCRLTIEHTPGGKIIPMYEFVTWNLLLFWKHNTSTLIIFVLFILMTLIYTFDHLHSLYLHCKNKNYPVWCYTLGCLEKPNNIRT
eukprot:UN09657